MKNIDKLKNPNINSEEWIKHLYYTKEKNYNVEHLKSMKDLTKKSVYYNVLKCFELVDELDLSENTRFYVEETLKYMEIAKVGSKEKRKEWILKGFDLFVHNIGSSEIYASENKDYNEIVRVLIKTHGLIGQYLRGEVNLVGNKELYKLIDKKLISKEQLKEVLTVLNYAVIGSISINLYNTLKIKINEVINKIINNKFEEKVDLVRRLEYLNSGLSDEEKSEIQKMLKNKQIYNKLNKLFNQVELWYFEAALGDFTIIQQIKMLLVCFNNIDNVDHLTFENIMKTIYIDHNGKKITNIFKKRIIEEYLNSLEINEILFGNVKPNAHLRIARKLKNKTLIVDFNFSIQAKKLIDFCMVASNSDALYKKSIYLLYDLFGFRRDKYDRFYNEIEYLNIMNASLQHKAKILDFMVGQNILDVGPGGGALINLIEEKDSNLNVYGIDISENVIDTLTKKKLNEKRKWNLIKGDALNLEEYFKVGSIDTIIYSSIIHELYSYIEYNGKKFNIETVIKTLKSAYTVLSKNGRIIIRDGIKTEPINQYRIIEFKNIEDFIILDRYCNDFKGRKITYEKIDNNKAKLLVNDAMEFLYTYTWGEDSYPLEVQEQFGYLTPTEYIELIESNLPNSNVLICNAFLQNGYEENLLNKITIYDEKLKITSLPNSTCILVIEKNN